MGPFWTHFGDRNHPPANGLTHARKWNPAHFCLPFFKYGDFAKIKLLIFTATLRFFVALKITTPSGNKASNRKRAPSSFRSGRSLLHFDPQILPNLDLLSRAKSVKWQTKAKLSFSSLKILKIFAILSKKNQCARRIPWRIVVFFAIFDKNEKPTPVFSKATKNGHFGDFKNQP